MSEADELQAMLAKARRYVRSAELLRAEGDHDSAVSRLYYAMFYCAAALLRTKGLGFSKHKAVISGFGQHFAKTGLLPPELHRWLQESFEKRQISDYEFISPDDAVVTDLASKASRFIETTETFLKQAGHL